MKYKIGESIYLQLEVRRQISMENNLELSLCPSFATVSKITSRIINEKKFNEIELSFVAGIIGTQKLKTVITEIDREWLESEIERVGGK